MAELKTKKTTASVSAFLNAIADDQARKGNITLDVLGNYPERDQLLAKLGVYKASGGCLHIKRLSDVHVPTLTKSVQASFKEAKKRDSRA